MLLLKEYFNQAIYNLKFFYKKINFQNLKEEILSLIITKQQYNKKIVRQTLN